MRKTNDKSIKEAIEQMMQVYKIKRKYDETGVISNWAHFVGKPVANRTKEIYISDKKLFVRIESSVIRNELVLVRSQIIDKINEEVGSKLIEEMVFI
ncbi:DUF721 domain-containing protein [Mucilaginibacter limnophilus]|uniref:DUF721 domain-containing protein n=1 Tax=Mucilaginibacter limnophilus TaxID=1932778 RepID=A0A437ML73_9SPHI|nr:DUF721 domain-containing protein [Mucilaginibacter limnophilus]RVT98365.1 DUF721 domain-containing protein [Mucilaginibacter limnophilus]